MVERRAARGRRARPGASPARASTIRFSTILAGGKAIRRAIARNFARLQFNIMHPQTTYNGPPPNYVELELQIVPFMAAIAVQALRDARNLRTPYRRSAFGLATVATLAYFARWLFSSPLAGILAALFLRDLARQRLLRAHVHCRMRSMVFFLTAALYAVGALSARRRDAGAARARADRRRSLRSRISPNRSP